MTSDAADAQTALLHAGLADLIAQRRLRPDPQRLVKIHPQTWIKWLGISGSQSGLPWLNTAEHVQVIGRADLVGLSQAAEADRSGDNLRRLFIAVMMWGSGTTNGRGPRYTAKALADGRIDETLAQTQRLVLDDQAEDAYTRFRLGGIGPAFSTKWFWAAGLDHRLRLRPLVLDARVWASLGELGWNSKVASGSNRRNLRYRAYLAALKDCASQGLAGVKNAEDIESLLFRWAGGRRSPQRGDDSS